MTDCGLCSKNIRKNIKCEFCAQYFHVKCANISTKDYLLSTSWSCLKCRMEIFPLTNLINEDLESAFIDHTSLRALPTKNTKCAECSKRIKKNKQGVYVTCKTCPNFFHKKCANQCEISPNWQCSKCTLGSLPFSKCNDMDYLANIFGFNDETTDFLKNVPKFSIQSLIDKLPGEHFDTNDFLSDSITSKYYTPVEFIREKFPKNKFSMLHLNIASLSAHIDELKSLLAILEHPFEVICLTETRIHEDKPKIDCKIEGYDFFHQKTGTQCGGAGIYVKTAYNPVKIPKYSVTHENI